MGSAIPPTAPHGIRSATRQSRTGRCASGSPACNRRCGERRHNSPGYMCARPTCRNNCHRERDLSRCLAGQGVRRRPDSRMERRVLSTAVDRTEVPSPQTFSGMVALVDQTPSGLTAHEISIDGATAFSWSENTSRFDLLSHTFPALQAARTVRITTTTSPSWVTWFEIQLTVPCSSTGYVPQVSTAPSANGALPAVAAKCKTLKAVVSNSTGSRICSSVVVNRKRVLRWKAGPPTTKVAAPVTQTMTPSPSPTGPISMKDAVARAERALAAAGIRVANTTPIYEAISDARINCQWVADGGYTSSDGHFYPFTTRDAAGDIPTREPRLTSYVVGLKAYCTQANYDAILAAAQNFK